MKSKEELIRFVQEIVVKSVTLKNAHTQEFDVPVNYACIFCQSEEQFELLKKLSLELGRVIEDTPTGPLIHFVPAIATVAGDLQLLKVRKPDVTRPELGDADFTVSVYEKFKQDNLSKPGFSLVTRPEFEMIELVAHGADVRVYFSNPPLDVQLGLVR